MLLGHLDLVERHLICGWAQDSEQPDMPVRLLVTVNDVLVARVVANAYRRDLERAGIGSGRHAFELRIEDGLPPLSLLAVRVRREVDGAELPNSPLLYEPAPEFDDLARRRLAAHLASAATEAALEERIEYLAEQISGLLQRLSERQGGHIQANAYRDLLRRWSRRLPGAGEQPPPLPPRRALVIDHTAPVAGRDAGSAAILSHVGALQRLGYDVAFAAADMGREGGAALEAAGATLYCAPFYASVEEVLQRLGGVLDLVYLHRLSVASRYTALVRHHGPNTRLVYGVADLHHLRVARQAEQQRRPELIESSRALRAAELHAARAADAVITHSSHEGRLLAAQCAPGRVHVVPWSVPVQPVPVPFVKRSGLAFIGYGGHAPNRDAARWLVDGIMPLVWRQAPAIECLLVGGELPDDLARPSDPRVVVLGHVPRLSEVFERVRLTVAPLTWGAGLKGKVAESLAAGVPCVCTAVAAEGYDLPPVLADLVADGAEALADKIVALHNSLAWLRACSQAGIALIRRDFSERRVDQVMAGACGRDAASEPRGG